jgi:putative transposase
MNTYKRHRFPPDIISYAVWLYYRFNLSHRDVEDLLAERDITFSREAIRLWCIKYGTSLANSLEQTHRSYGCASLCVLVMKAGRVWPVGTDRLTRQYW